MGRIPWTTRLTVEEWLSLDVCVFKTLFRQNRIVVGTYRWHDNSRANCAAVNYRVIPDCCSGPALAIGYMVGTNRTSVEYSVSTTTTRCTFGRPRVWFVCPLVRNGFVCRKRIRKLFLPPGAKYFGCRYCYNLTYEGRQTHDKRVDRLLRLPLEELNIELYLDAAKCGSLASRMGRILHRRLAKKVLKSGHTSTNYRGHLAFVPRQPSDVNFSAPIPGTTQGTDWEQNTPEQDETPSNNIHVSR